MIEQITPIEWAVLYYAYFLYAYFKTITEHKLERRKKDKAWLERQAQSREYYRTKYCFGYFNQHLEPNRVYKEAINHNSYLKLDTAIAQRLT